MSDRAAVLASTEAAELKRWKAELEAELRRREAVPDTVAPAAALKAEGDRSAAPVKREETAEPPTPPTPPTPPASVPDSAAVVNKLREEGNARMRAGDPARAAELYSEALRPASTGTAARVPPGSSKGSFGMARTLVITPYPTGVNRVMSATTAATLYSNRAAAHVALSSWEAAATDAQAAVVLQPGHAKALHRLATALSALGRFREAMKACRAGEAALAAADDRSAVFQLLIEQVSTAAALNGSVAAFDGRILHVRSAGEDAWLCREAPMSVEHDAEEPERIALLPWEETDLWGGADAVSDGAIQVARAEHDAAAAKRKAETALTKPLSFRSMSDAMDAARDGDRIVVQLGHHNMGGSVMKVSKRVLIRGEGELGDTVIEQRGNAPLFHFTVPAVVQNLVLDLCGFRECLLFEGDERCTALVEGCNIRCSGDHSVVCVGSAAPTLRRCDISARKAGLLTMDSSRPHLQDCTLGPCEHQGLRATDSSWPRLDRCRITDGSAEGIVAMDNACVEAADCTLSGNKGPGVDLSGSAHASLSRCVVTDNAGGLFMWGVATATLQKCQLNGGPHHALLADCGSRPTARDCAFDGDLLLLSEETAEGVKGAGLYNTIKASKEPAKLPAEEGCFKFEADRYTRKQ